jgi:uncharacterized protein
MARAKADLPSAAAVRALLDSEGRIAVRVTPGARSERVGIEDGRLCVKTRANPQDGAANAAVCKLVADALGTAPCRVGLLRGETSRDKLLVISLSG